MGLNDFRLVVAGPCNHQASLSTSFPVDEEALALLASFVFTFPPDRVFVLDLGAVRTYPDIQTLLHMVCVVGGVPAKKHKGYYETKPSPEVMDSTFFCWLFPRM